MSEVQSPPNKMARTWLRTKLKEELMTDYEYLINRSVPFSSVHIKHNEFNVILSYYLYILFSQIKVPVINVNFFYLFL